MFSRLPSALCYEDISMTLRAPTWLPVSWLYVSLGIVNLWRRLNFGDRCFLVGFLSIMVVTFFGFAEKLCRYAEENFPGLLPIAIAAAAFIPIVLLFNLTLISVRANRFDKFLAETRARRRWRIGLEAVVATFCSLSVVLMLILKLQLPTPEATLIQSSFLAIGAHGIWNLVHWTLGGSQPSASIPIQYDGRKPRSKLISEVLARNPARCLPATSSRFLLKSVTNPWIWIGLAFMALSVGGVVVSAPNPALWTLLVFSIALLTVQFAVMEPRVGNGLVLGVHSVRTPIRRALSDFAALMVPHLAILGLATILFGFQKDWLGLGISFVQGVLSFWVLWLALMMKALPRRVVSRYILWSLGGGIIAGQLSLGLVIFVFIAATIVMTRDMILMTWKEPVLWPRP